MAILLSNDQDVDIDEDLLIRLAEHALSTTGADAKAELSIALVDEETMRDLNSRYRGKEYPTDVLSFPSGTREAGAPEAPRVLGDVVICPAVAERQAKEYDQTFEQEMALLLVHGILHLLGYDHEETAQAEAMEAEEREILSSFFDGEDTGAPQGGVSR